MLYSRDYSVLSSEDQNLYDDLKSRETSSCGSITGIRRNLFSEYTKPIRHFVSLFPNNYLDQCDLTREEEKLRKQCEDYLKLINNKTTKELDIKSWIKSNEAYHLIGSILSCYNFGHHDAYLFSEFKLGTSFASDYLLVGQNSDGYHFVFCEFESIYGRKAGKVIKKDGSFGIVINKGLSQIDNWKNYINQNYSCLENEFKKNKNLNLLLPDEFKKFHLWQTHYVIVAGRREDFSKRARELRTQCESERDISILHYDNLYSNLKKCIGRATY